MISFLLFILTFYAFYIDSSGKNNWFWKQYVKYLMNLEIFSAFF